MTRDEAVAQEAKRTASDVMRDIEAKLATMDGIATADAFALGGLVREYGEKKAGETGSAIMTPLLDMMMRPPKKDEPWK